MEKFKKLFPLTAKFSKNGNSLAIGLLIYVGIWLLSPVAASIIAVVVSLITCGLATGLAAPIGFIVGVAAVVYVVAGIVFLILDYSKASKADAVVETKAEETPETDDAE